MIDDGCLFYNNCKTTWCCVYVNRNTTCCIYLGNISKLENSCTYTLQLLGMFSSTYNQDFVYV